MLRARCGGGFAVAVVNPKQARDFAGYGPTGEDDRIDAPSLAELAAALVRRSDLARFTGRCPMCSSASSRLVTVVDNC